MSPDSAAALLSELAAKSITLAVEGDYLRCRPQSAVTRDLVERIRGHKAELLAILQDTDTTDTDRTIAVGSESGFVAENTPLLLYSQAERDLLAGAPTDMWRAVDRIKQAFSGAQVIDVFRSPVNHPPPSNAPKSPCLSGRTEGESPRVESNMNRARTARKNRLLALRFSAR